MSLPALTQRSGKGICTLWTSYTLCHFTTILPELSLYNVGTTPTVNTISNSYIVACVPVAAETCLSSRCLETDQLSSRVYPAVAWQRLSLSVILSQYRNSRAANSLRSGFIGDRPNFPVRPACFELYIRENKKLSFKNCKAGGKAKPARHITLFLACSLPL
jgi:hypothetical protein